MQSKKIHIKGKYDLRYLDEDKRAHIFRKKQNTTIFHLDATMTQNFTLLANLTKKCPPYNFPVRAEKMCLESESSQVNHIRLYLSNIADLAWWCLWHCLPKDSSLNIKIVLCLREKCCFFPCDMHLQTHLYPEYPFNLIVLLSILYALDVCWVPTHVQCAQKFHSGKVRPLVLWKLSLGEVSWDTHSYVMRKTAND